MLWFYWSCYNEWDFYKYFLKGEIRPYTQEYFIFWIRALDMSWANQILYSNVLFIRIWKHTLLSLKNRVGRESDAIAYKQALIIKPITTAKHLTVYRLIWGYHIML